MLVKSNLINFQYKYPQNRKQINLQSSPSINFKGDKFTKNEYPNPTKTERHPEKWCQFSKDLSEEEKKCLAEDLSDFENACFNSVFEIFNFNSDGYKVNKENDLQKCKDVIEKQKNKRPEVQRDFLLCKNKNGESIIFRADLNSNAQIELIKFASELKDRKAKEDFVFQKNSSGNTPLMDMLAGSTIEEGRSLAMIKFIDELNDPKIIKKVLSQESFEGHKDPMIKKDVDLNNPYILIRTTPFIQTLIKGNVPVGSALMKLASKDPQVEKEFTSSVCKILAKSKQKRYGDLVIIPKIGIIAEDNEEILSRFLEFAAKVVPDEAAKIKIPKYIPRYGEIIKELSENVSNKKERDRLRAIYQGYINALEFDKAGHTD